VVSSTRLLFPLAAVLFFVLIMDLSIDGAAPLTKKFLKYSNTTQDNTHLPISLHPPLQFIHPQKTGSSFVNALFLLGCPEEFNSTNWTNPNELRMHSARPGYGLQGGSPECGQRWTHGDPLGTHIRNKWFIGEHAFRNTSLGYDQIFMAVREPVDRLLSWLFFYGKSRRKYFSKSVITDEFIAQYILDKKESLEGQLSRMTSMLFPTSVWPTAEDLKERPNATMALLQNLTAESCNMMNRFAWVGLTKKFNQSLCVLHALFDFPHHPLEAVNMRPNTQMGKKRLNGTHVGELLRERMTILDDKIYKCAEQRLLKDVERYAPHCAC